MSRATTESTLAPFSTLNKYRTHQLRPRTQERCSVGVSKSEVHVSPRATESSFLGQLPHVLRYTDKGAAKTGVYRYDCSRRPFLNAVPFRTALRLTRI